MNDRWRQRKIRVQMLLGMDRTVEWNGCKWYLDKRNGDPEGGLLWDEPAALQMIRPHFLEGKVFADIGANVGGYSIRAAKAGMRVYSFEPNPTNLEFLKTNLEINSCEVIVRPVALGSKEDTKTISDRFAESKITTREGILVFQETLDAQKLDALDLVKIDVEGYELEVLNGAINTLVRFRPKMMIELHDSLSTRDYCQLFAMLADLGYDLKQFGNIPGKGIFMRRYVWCDPR